MTYDETLHLLEKYNQEHLLKFYNELDEHQKENLLNQISKIDFEYEKSLYENKDDISIIDNDIAPIQVISKEKIDTEKYDRIGEEYIKTGKLAVCSMAGGQGTRLGFDGPKGCYILDLDKPTSIFETIVKKLQEAYDKYNVCIYWYIMTSNQNHNETVGFFEQNNYFGYDKNHIIFFNQGELPLLDIRGKIALRDKANIFMAPDGNGGIFRALKNENIIEHMKNNNIKYLAVGNVDNILINMIDSTILGLMVDEQKDLASKSFMKPTPQGKWGVFCKKNGKPQVIEYIETPKELIEARNENNELLYGDAHFGCNYFDIDLLERISTEKLPMHAACKKNSILENSGEYDFSNTYKFEAFIFDSFEKANDVLIYRVKKDEEFAPIKNKEGDESPETAVELYKKFYGI